MDSIAMALTLMYATVMTIAAVFVVVAGKLAPHDPIPIRVEEESHR